MPQLNIGDISLTGKGALQGRVAFAAMQNGSNSGNGNTNGTQIFQTEHVDTHNAYNNSTGIFIAPVSGVYFFYASLMGGNSDARSVHYISKSTNGGSSWDYLVQFGGQAKQYNQFTTSVVSNLNANDQVSVRNSSYAVNLYTSSTQEAVFGGYLIG
tara:strand:- start:526 stop:993 length:468 start_codon:yes stop_codon:yes gene_type:complete